MFLVLFVIAGIFFTVMESRVRFRQSLVPDFQVDWEAVIDDPSVHLDLVWLGNYHFPQARDETWIENQMEERFNVELKGLFMDQRAYLRGKPLAFMGGSIPDVIWEANTEFLRRDAYHGFLLEIPYDVIRKHAPTYMDQVNRYAPDGWLQTHWEGKNYGLPLFVGFGRHPRPGMWRMDWLRNVGIEKVPETLDETFEALWRFRHRDPDGNGEKDTYGMSPVRSGNQAFPKVFAAFGVLPYDWMIKEGQIVWGGTLPECKEALSVLRRWYREELIDPDFLTAPEGSANRISANKFRSGRTGYQSWRGAWIQVSKRNQNSLGYYYYMKDRFPDLELAPGKFPLGPRGDCGMRAPGNTAGAVFAFGKHLERDPRKVTRVLRIFEQLAEDDEFHAEMITGERGTHWDYSDELGIVIRSEFVEDRKKLLITRIDTANGFYAPFSLLPESLSRYFAKDEVEYLQTHRNERYNLPRALATPQMIPSAKKHWTNLLRLQEAAFFDIIRGERDLADFDDFVEDWYDSGGREFVEDAREFYKIRREIFQRLGIAER